MEMGPLLTKHDTAAAANLATSESASSNVKMSIMIIHHEWHFHPCFKELLVEN